MLLHAKRKINRNSRAVTDDREEKKIPDSVLPTTKILRKSVESDLRQANFEKVQKLADSSSHKTNRITELKHNVNYKPMNIEGI